MTDRLVSGVPKGSITLAVLRYVELQTALLMPSGAAVLVYMIGSATGTKLLKAQRGKRMLPWISLVISIAVRPFVGPLALVALLTGAAALAYSLVARRVTTERKDRRV